METFNRFYGMMPIYELTQQWILRDGEFNCDFSWMSDNYDQVSFGGWANDSFKEVFGVDLSAFEILAPE